MFPISLSLGSAEAFTSWKNATWGGRWFHRAFRWRWQSLGCTHSSESHAGTICRGRHSSEHQRRRCPHLLFGHIALGVAQSQTPRLSPSPAALHFQLPRAQWVAVCGSEVNFKKDGAKVTSSMSNCSTSPPCISSPSRCFRTSKPELFLSPLHSFPTGEAADVSRAQIFGVHTEGAVLSSLRCCGLLLTALHSPLLGHSLR